MLTMPILVAPGPETVAGAGVGVLVVPWARAREETARLSPRLRARILILVTTIAFRAPSDSQAHPVFFRVCFRKRRARQGPPKKTSYGLAGAVAPAGLLAA